MSGGRNSSSNDEGDRGHQEPARRRTPGARGAPPRRRQGGEASGRGRRPWGGGGRRGEVRAPEARQEGRRPPRQGHREAPRQAGAPARRLTPRIVYENETRTSPIRPDE